MVTVRGESPRLEGIYLPLEDLKQPHTDTMEDLEALGQKGIPDLIFRMFTVSDVVSPADIRR